MRPDRPLPDRRTARRAALAVVGACLAVGAAASPAAADNDLESASPYFGSKLKSAPGQVRLTFDEMITPGNSRISVTGPDGDATDGGSNVFGREISRRLRSDLPDGRYTVSYEVAGLLGTNGERGSYTFLVGTPARPSASAPAPRPTPTRTPSATPTPSAEASATPTPTPTRTALAPAAVSTLRPSPGPVATAAPTAAVPRPAVAAIDSRRDEWLPPPVFWWAVIVLTATAIGAAPKIRRWWLATHPPKPRRGATLAESPAGTLDETPAIGTALLDAERPVLPPEPRLTPPTGALRTPTGELERDALHR